MSDVTFTCPTADARNIAQLGDVEALALRLALGGRAHHHLDTSGDARGWCVAISTSDNDESDAVRITAWHESSTRATGAALFIAVTNSTTRRNRKIPKGQSGIAVFLEHVEARAACPVCRAPVFRISFTAITLGVKCVRCTYEAAIVE